MACLLPGPLALDHRLDLDLVACKRLVLHLARMVNHGGSDIRASTGEVFRSSRFAWFSCLSTWWRWKIVQSCKWRHGQSLPIAYLEMLAFANLQLLALAPGA
eukprot:5110435-Amphidinium_carterae.1